MALFNDAFVQEIATLVSQRYHTLGIALGGQPTTQESGQLRSESPLRRDLELLMQIANGERLRSETTDGTHQQVEEALKRLVELLFGNVQRTPIMIPDDFWGSQAGVLLSRVRWWLSPDELITISNAAALAFGKNTQANRMRIARAMEKGVLEWVPDPSVANPQQNRRVLRSQVERLHTHLP
jgi:hypothetical protein